MKACCLLPCHLMPFCVTEQMYVICRPDTTESSASKSRGSEHIAVCVHSYDIEAVDKDQRTRCTLSSQGRSFSATASGRSSIGQ